MLDVDEDEENLRGTFSNEVHFLDLGSLTWRQVTLSGVKEKKTRRKKDHDAHGNKDATEHMEEDASTGLKFKN